MTSIRIFAFLILANLIYANEAKLAQECIENRDKKMCETLIKANALSSLQKCVVTCQSIGVDNYCPKSCNSVGLIYMIAGEYNQAMAYFKKSISLGNEYPYLHFIHLHYKSGNMEALQMLDARCNQNKNKSKEDKEIQAMVCDHLGHIYLNGRGILGAGKGVEQNYKKAFDYLRKSCDFGLENIAFSCAKVGFLLLYGDGVRQDSQSAKSYFGKACDLGHQFACDKYNELNKQ